MSSNDAVHTDSILAELGSFGRFQIVNYFFIAIPIAFSAIYTSNYVFTAGALEYRCFVPECETWRPEFEVSEWSDWAFPDGDRKCTRLQPLNSTCGQESFHINATIPCDKWIFESYDTSIVSTFELACTEWKRTLVGTVHNVGALCALPLTGYLSDRFGRRTVLVMTALGAAISGLGRSFSVNYVMYIVLEFVDALLGTGVYSTGFILALEMVSLKHRVLGGNLISSTFATGQIILALLAWFFPDWRTLTRVLYVPSFFFIFYCFLVEESVRWLISNGRKKEAAKIIFKAAKINKKELSPEAIKYLSAESQQKPEQNSGKNGTVKKSAEEPSLLRQVLRSKILLSRLCICAFWWITVTFIYYGLSINSVLLAGNRYVNYILSSLVEIPGYGLSVLTLDRFGRKSAIMTAYFICGLSLLSLPFIPETLHWLTIVLSLVAKLFISMVFSSIYIYTSELFPTVWRHRFLSACSMIGRIGSITAPQTPLLTQYMVSLPYIIFGIMAGCSGALTLLTPETLRMRLPDTVKQAEDISASSRASEES